MVRATKEKMMSEAQQVLLIYSIKDKTRIKYNRLYDLYEPYQLKSIVLEWS